MFESLTGNITQGKLYELAGRTDDICTFSLLEGSSSNESYGSVITVQLFYTHNERRILEDNINGMDNKPIVSVKYLNSIKRLEKEKIDKLNNYGIPIEDIVDVMTMHYTPVNNRYGIKEKRVLNSIIVPFKPYGKGRDIGWIYGFMCKKKERCIGFMPDEEDLYIAYRFILDRDKMSEDDRLKVFDRDGHLVMSNVGYHYLMWGLEAGLLKDCDKELLRQLKRMRVRERYELLKDELRRVGIPFNKFRRDYKTQALYFLHSLYRFNDRSLNIMGKHPLFMNYRSFVYIYIRHVNEFNIGKHLVNEDKFQLYEEDVFNMIDHVMHELEDDYQQFREQNPERKYRRTGEKAFYCNGDYYEVYVDKDGRLETFYNATGNKQLNNGKQ